MSIATFDPATASEGDVMTMQRFLQTEGFYLGKIDGKFGPISNLARIKYITSLHINSPIASIVDVIQGVYVFLHKDGTLSWLSGCESDSDGIGPHYGDHTAQGDTSAHHDGHAYNADLDAYSVYPTQVLHAALPRRVKGCQGHVYHTVSGEDTPTVFADCGGRGKAGEAAMLTLRRLKIPWSPVSGGEHKPVVLFHCCPDVPAEVNGKTYPLQS